MPLTTSSIDLSADQGCLASPFVFMTTEEEEEAEDQIVEYVEEQSEGPLPAASPAIDYVYLVSDGRAAQARSGRRRRRRQCRVRARRLRGRKQARQGGLMRRVESCHRRTQERSDPLVSLCDRLLVTLAPPSPDVTGSSVHFLAPKHPLLLFASCPGSLPASRTLIAANPTSPASDPTRTSGQHSLSAALSTRIDLESNLYTRPLHKRKDTASTFITSNAFQQPLSPSR